MTCRVVIIDDDREMCEEIKDILVDEGYSVRTAFNGTDGLAIIGEYGCDVLLLDLKMPGLDGLAVLKEMQAVASRPSNVSVTVRSSIVMPLCRARIGHSDQENPEFLHATSASVQRLRPSPHFRQLPGFDWS